MITEIYAITDADGNPKYVGRTTAGLRWRFQGHAYAKNEIGEWIRANREDARIRLLETIDPYYTERGNRERYWINHYREQGHQLFNKWPMPRRFEKALTEIEKERMACL